MDLSSNCKNCWKEEAHELKDPNARSAMQIILLRNFSFLMEYDFEISDDTCKIDMKIYEHRTILDITVFLHL